MKTPLKIAYCLYDSRYLTNPDRATLYEVCDNLKEVRREIKESFTDAIVVKETLQMISYNKYEVIKSEIINP